MSRISQTPVGIVSGVQCAVQQRVLSVKGPKGQLTLPIPKGVDVTVADEGVVVCPTVKTKEMPKEISMLCGTVSRLASNMIKGVSEGFEKTMELIGVGYKSELQGNKLKLSLGFSHDIFYPIAADITIQMIKPTSFKILGIDKQRVGQVAAEIRRYRPPEPYKGKGVHRVGDFVRRKEGKAK
jgi:large subunit ribosomal protein L6